MLHPQATSRHSSITVEESFGLVFIPFHWVFGEGNKKKEREKLWEIKHIFFALLYMYCCGCV